MNPLQIPDQELVSVHRYVESWDITVTGDGWEELSEVSAWCSDEPRGLGPPVDDRDTRQVVMCLWGGLGSAGSGSGPASGCGWSAGRRPGSWGRPVLRSRRSWGGCRGPRRTDWCRSRPHALDCWCCCCSRCWMTQSPRHPGLAQEREDADLCSASSPGAPGGRSPHHRHCAAVSCCQSTYDDSVLISMDFLCMWSDQAGAGFLSVDGLSPELAHWPRLAS